MVEQMQVDSSAAEDLQQNVVNKRVLHQGKLGTIRFLGKLVNNEKAGDSLWLGIEWDEEGKAKNNGTVDGVTYFTPVLHPQSPNSCSFIRYGKVQIGGIDFAEAIKEKYQPDSMKTEEEIQMEKQKQEMESYVQTNKEGGVKKIEMLIDESQFMKADISKLRDISLESMKISELGEEGSLGKLIPGVMNLNLDKNMLYSWDQYFAIIKQLPMLRLLILTGNKFAKIDQSWVEGKDLSRMVHTSLSELVLIDMNLDWSQIDILAPTLVYVEQLLLVRNKCSQIFSQFKLPKQHFKVLKFINLEENGITSWDEIDEFRKLPNLKRFTLNKNPIKQVKWRDGWPELQQLALEDCQIADWQSINEINLFYGLKAIRLQKNPILDSDEQSREMIIARCKSIKNLNGGDYQDGERRDFEKFYMKRVYKEFLEMKGVQALNSEEDPELVAYTEEYHPRFFELCAKYGSPIDVVPANNQPLPMTGPMIKVALESGCRNTMGMIVHKELPAVMVVEQLVELCSELFKAEKDLIEIIYRGGGPHANLMIEGEGRPLSFFQMTEGCLLFVRAPGEDMYVRVKKR